MPVFASHISPEFRARHQAWRRGLCARLDIAPGSPEDRHLSRLILEWRILKAKITVMDDNHHPVPDEEREQLEQLTMLLGEGVEDPIGAEVA